ncbi:MAG TPA: peptide ABC transporter substrate-binding protein [Chthoniobacterales bacterium]
MSNAGASCSSRPAAAVCTFQVAPVFLCLLACFAFIFPAKAETRADIAAKNKILLIGNGAEPKTLDPQLATGVLEYHVFTALMEGLIANHPTDQSLPEPGLADKWERNADASEWTFHIRSNAKWSNGDPVKASDFVFAYQRLLSPGLAAEYADMLFILTGAENYHKGRTTDFGTVGAKALDDHTLKLSFVGPTPYLLTALVHQAWYPLNPATVLKFGKIDDRVSLWTRPENYVGTGPFQLKEWKPNEIISVERNPNYWDAANVKLNGIEFYPIEDQNTEERAFRAGQLHKTNEVPLDKIPAYKRDNPGLIRTDPFFGIYYYHFNLTNPIFKDVRVRQALSLAIDRESIVENITRGGQQSATGFTPAGMGAYKTPELVEYDPDKARELLKEAGYLDGKGFPKLDVLINTSEANRTIAEAIQDMWKQELGISVGIRNEEWKVYLESRTNLHYQICRAAWIGGYIDPVAFLRIWTTDGSNNNSGWSNKEYDALIAESDRTSDPAKRFGILRKAEAILLADGPVAPIYWYTRVYLLGPHVVNWNPLVLDNHNYKYIDLK